MRLQSLHNVLPPYRFSQIECLRRFQSSPVFHSLSERSKGILQKVLSKDNGIDFRNFATPHPEDLQHFDADALHAYFAIHAPNLGAQALKGALEQAHLRPADLDALFVCTCTGYLCPGLSSYIAEALNLPSTAY